MTMKNSINRLNKVTAAQARNAADFEAILFAGERKYQNTMVESTNAEVYALRHAVEVLHGMVVNQNDTIANIMQYVATLENKIDTLEMKALRTGTIQADRTTKAIAPVPTEDTASSNRINIDWSNPVQTAFRLFDGYCTEHHHITAITPDIVKANWSTLFSTCKSKTGMTLGRLLKQYAKERGLNY